PSVHGCCGRECLAPIQQHHQKCCAWTHGVPFIPSEVVRSARICFVRWTISSTSAAAITKRWATEPGRPSASPTPWTRAGRRAHADVETVVPLQRRLRRGRSSRGRREALLRERETNAWGPRRGERQY